MGHLLDGVRGPAGDRGTASPPWPNLSLFLLKTSTPPGRKGLTPSRACTLEQSKQGGLCPSMGQNKINPLLLQFGNERGQTSSALPCWTTAGHRRCQLLVPRPCVVTEVSPPGWEPGAFTHTATGVLAPCLAKPRHFLDSE